MNKVEHDLDLILKRYVGIIRLGVPLSQLQIMFATKTFFSIPRIEPSELHAHDDALKMLGEIVLSQKEKNLLTRRIKEALKGEISRMKKIESQTDEEREKTRNLPPTHESILQSMAEQLEDLDERQLEAGLGVILKDTLQYLFTAPRPDDALFRELINAVITEEQKTKTAAEHRLIYVDPHDPIPTGIVASVVKGERDLSRLRSPKIQHEWTIYPARIFLKKFNAKLKKNICGRSGVYGQFKKHMLGQADLPTTIAATIVTGHFSPEAVWYPLAIYVGILIAKTGLDTYCEKKPKARTVTKRAT